MQALVNTLGWMSDIMKGSGVGKWKLVELLKLVIIDDGW